MRNIAIYQPVTIQPQIKSVNHFDCFEPVEFNPINQKINFLNQIQRIPNNWDGYGAKAPNKNTIENAIKFLKILPQIYQKMLNLEELSITPYGTVIMDWNRDENSFISIEIGATKIGFFSETADNLNPYKEKLDLKSDAISKDILPVFTKVFSTD